MCICCQEVVCQPVTTPCAHNICKVTAQPSFHDPHIRGDGRQRSVNEFRSLWG